MKTLFKTLALAALVCLCTNGYADDLRKKVVGKWYNPYTYASSGELKGFQFKKNGTCKALGIEGLDLHKWYIKDGKLYVEGQARDKDTDPWEEYKTVEFIDKANADTLYLLQSRKPYKIGFLYLSPKALKQKVEYKGGASKK